MMPAWIGIILMLFQLNTVNTSSQDKPVTESESLGVRDAINIAYKNNPKINQLKEKIKAQKQLRWSSVGLSSPELYYFKEGIPEKGAGIGHSDFIEQRLGISQSIQFPLTSIYQYQKNNFELKALNTDLMAFKAQLKANVKKYYTNIALAIKLYQLSQIQVKLAKQVRDAVMTRYQVGESGQIDVLKADVQLSEANNDLDDANRQLHDSRYNLFYLIGLDPEKQSYAIEFSDTLRYFEYHLDQKSILKTIPEQPQLKSLNNRLSSSNFALREARSRYLPEIGVSYYKQDYTNGFDFHGFQVGLSIPLWFPFNQHVTTQIVRSNRNEIRWMKQATLLSLKKNIETTWHGYANSLKTIKRYHEEIQNKSETLLQMTLEGYREGELDLLTLLDTQRTYLTSQKRYYQSLHNYYFQLIELEKFLQTDIVYQ